MRDLTRYVCALCLAADVAEELPKGWLHVQQSAFDIDANQRTFPVTLRCGACLDAELREWTRKREPKWNR
jgi:hypothetical protein